MSTNSIVHVPLSGRAYDIVVGRNQLNANGADHLAPFVSGHCCFIVSDSNVDPLYGPAATALCEAAGASQVARATFTAGESSKNHETLLKLYADAVAAGVDRKSVLLALGGGVVGDTAGFVAASYMRGIDFIQLPTSVLAHVDSSVGGKTGVDLPSGKNLVGAFHQPKLVLIDVDTVATLPPRELRCGLSEVVKYGVIMDAELFAFLEANVDALLRAEPEPLAHIIQRSCELKAEVVLEDEFENGRRAILNYGHTFGHAIERVTEYTTYTHGEAIAIGMGMAVELALLRGEDDELHTLKTRQDDLFTAFGLPTRQQGLEPESIMAAMGSDKKYVRGANRLIVPQGIGAVDIVTAVPDELILEAIRRRSDQS